MARTFTHPASQEITLDGILYALSDPIRRSIVSKLLHADRLSCTKACTNLPPSTISFHHKILRESGLIRSEKIGVAVINSVRQDEIESRFPGLLQSILQYHPST
ncbi:MAG: ArsR/SmtB family transcription factor [Candidatus Sericytochromatia bacterium]